MLYTLKTRFSLTKESLLSEKRTNNGPGFDGLVQLLTEYVSAGSVFQQYLKLIDIGLILSYLLIDEAYAQTSFF